LNFAGGGTEDVNSKTVIGVIYDATNKPAANTQVILIPYNYNPVSDGAIPDSLKDTTDKNGIYVFHTADSGAFNVQATHIFERTQAFIPEIKTTHDTTFAPFDTLKGLGTLKIFLPDSIDTVNGYVYIPGTMIHKNLSSINSKNLSRSITIDSLPEATFTAAYYDVLNDPYQPVVLTDTLSIFENDTLVIETVVFWAQYTIENSSLLSNHVFCICEGADEALWFGTFAGAARFNGTTWTNFTTANSGLRHNYVYDIERDKYGTLWFATQGGFSSFNGSVWNRHDSLNARLKSKYTTCIQFDKYGNIWIGTYAGGLVKVNKYATSLTIYDTSNCEIPQDSLNDLAIDKEGTIWVATILKGIGKLSGQTWTVYDTTNSPIRSNNIFKVTIDSLGNKWFGYHQGGVSKLEGSKWETYYAGSSIILMGAIYTSEPDMYGNMWFGTTIGLTKYDGKIWTNFVGEKYKLLQDKWVYSIFIDKDNNKWVGTKNCGLIAFGPTIKPVKASRILNTDTKKVNDFCNRNDFRCKGYYR